MNAKKIVAGLALVDFAALNAWAFYKEGLEGLMTFLGGLTPWGYVLAADLLIALGMVCVWMYADAKKKGRNPMGYLALTAATGSIGPLLYVTMEGAEVAAPAGKFATSS